MRSSLLITAIVFFVSCSVTKPTKVTHPYTGKQLGCGDFIVYKLTDNGNELVSVSLTIDKISLQTSQVYGIGKTDVLEVKRKKYSGAIDASLCNDVMTEKPIKEVDEIASSGIVEVLLSTAEIEKAKRNEPYLVTVTLKNVVFEGLEIDYLKIENVNVGWLPG